MSCIMCNILNVFIALVALIIIAFTFYVIFKDNDVKDFGKRIKSAINKFDKKEGTQ